MSRRAFKIIEAALERLRASPERELLSNIRESIDRLEEITSADFYSEPGYESHKGLILFGNWNSTLPKQASDFAYSLLGDEFRIIRNLNIIDRVTNLLEKLGCDIQWEDEWTTCSHCCGAVRTNADGWGWKKSFYENDGEILCAECVKKDPTEYLEWLEGNERRADSFDLPLKNLGYICVVEDLQNGFHHGQDADPKVIAKHLRANGIERFVFSLDSTGQFDITFSTWVHKDEKEKIEKLNLNVSANTDGPSVSEAMERSLRNGSLAASQLPSGPGVVYIQGHPDGSASATKVPNEEFGKDGVRKAEARIAAGDPSVVTVRTD